MDYSDWYGFDTENDENGNVTLACLIHESGESWVWKKAGELIKWCDKQTGNPVVICHNLEYDLINEFGSRYPYMQLNYLKGRLISAKFGRVKFLDSFNHFRMSLKKLGESLGIEKKEMDIYSEEYVTTDAWICLKAMTEARDYIAGLGGKIGATSGSSAVSIWRHMTDDEFVTGAVDTPWLRKGYYGGRTEIFRPKTEGRILVYDINSMYPFVMMNAYPEYLGEDPRFERLKGMAEVTISIPHDLYVAPLVHRSETGRLAYPVGVIRGVWTYDEIREAERRGAKIQKVHKAYGCSSLVRPFDDFIMTLYNRRKRKDTSPADKLFLKVMMNSLYGKLASKNVITRMVSRHTLLKNKSKRIDEVTWVDHNRGMLNYTSEQPDYVNVCWGAMITAFSRLLLTKYFLKVPENQLIYGDTDSIWTNDFELPTGNELGQLKLEKEESSAYIPQPKVYALGNDYTAKGVPKPKEVNGKKLDFAKSYIEDGFTQFQAPIRFRASLTSKRGKANQWVTHSKSMRTEYAAKILSGDRYYPPVIGEQLQLGLELSKSKKRGLARKK